MSAAAKLRTTLGVKTGFPIKHGKSGTPEFNVWTGIKKRCFDKNCKSYPRYGGRGITLCPEWVNDFPAFLNHVGQRPSCSHTIDRIDNSRGYEPGNLRWATVTEQNQNTRRNVLLGYNGTTKLASLWAVELGIPYRTILSRLKKGWSIARALGEPSRIAKFVPTREQLREIARLRLEGLSWDTIAPRFNVSHGTLWRGAHNAGLKTRASIEWLLRLRDADLIGEDVLEILEQRKGGE